MSSWDENTTRLFQELLFYNAAIGKLKIRGLKNRFTPRASF